MKTIKSIVATSCLVGALFGANPVSAQSAQLDADEVAAAARYSLPVAFDGFMRRCSSSLSSSGYAATNARSLRQKFATGVDAAWPGAKSLILEFAKREAGDMASLFDMMGDESLRPFVDGLVGNLVEQEIKLDDCGTIERGLEIFDPLPADNLAAAIGLLVVEGMSEEEQNQ